MIRVIAPLLMLLSLLASWPSGGAGATSPEPANGIEAAAIFDPVLRRADLIDATDGADAPAGALASGSDSAFALSVAPMPFAVVPRRESGPIQARAPPRRDVFA